MFAALACSVVVFQGHPLCYPQMGSTALCGQPCDPMAFEEFEAPLLPDADQTERIRAARELFALTDLNDDGFVTVGEFATMGLNQTKVHREKDMTLQEEQHIKDQFVQKYFREIDPSYRPMTLDEYAEYILWSVNEMDPGDHKVGIKF